MRNSLGWLVVPIAAYLVITLGLPAANGALHSSAFLTHARWVVLGCAVIIPTAAGIARLWALAGHRGHS